MKLFSLIFVTLLLLISSGCASKNPEMAERSYRFLKEQGEMRLNRGENAEAFLISIALLNHEPSDREAMEIRDRALAAQPDLKSLNQKGILGSNIATRQKRPSGIFRKVIFYPVNVVTNFLDIFTIELGTAFGVGAKVQVTEVLSAGAQISAGESLIGIRNRHPGVRSTVENHLDLVTFEARQFNQSSASTRDLLASQHHGFGPKSPYDDLYQYTRDYYAIGAKAQVVFIAANVQVHPVQIFDFLAGLFFMDPLNDNIGTTRAIRLDEDEKQNIRRLNRGR